MLYRTFRNPRRLRLGLHGRALATETIPSSTQDLPPPTKHPPPPKSRTRLYPHPRPANTHKHQALPILPPSFGRNQLLPVSNSTRALLEEIVAKFDAPIRYAFAYGSGVFEQDGYTFNSKAGAPMLDFMFAVTHPAHWHSINMQTNPGHYAIHARTFGSRFVSTLEDMGPGVWFNAFVPMSGVVSLFPISSHSCLMNAN
jgi:translocator assembly and maintenance protein 41